MDGALARLRKAKGFTQQQAATVAGVSNMTVSRVERGRGMSMDTATKLARIYGVTLEALLSAYREPSSTSVAPEAAAAEA